MILGRANMIGNMRPWTWINTHMHTHTQINTCIGTFMYFARNGISKKPIE